jgi:hypothetical protein
VSNRKGRRNRNLFGLSEANAGEGTSGKAAIQVSYLIQHGVCP